MERMSPEYRDSETQGRKELRMAAGQIREGPAVDMFVGGEGLEVE